jgi:hypothetical protein
MTTVPTRSQLLRSGIRKAESRSERALKMWAFSKSTINRRSTLRASWADSPRVAWRK